MVDIQTISIVFTGLSISLAAFYYINTLRNAQENQRLQLETRQAQLFMQVYMHYQKEIDWTKTWPIISTKLSGMDEYFEKVENDDYFRKTINDFVNFYEGLGVIVREGYLSIRLIALMWAGTTITFWENIVEPLLKDDMREKTGFKRGWSETEYLCRTLIKYLEEHPELAN